MRSILAWSAAALVAIGCGSKGAKAGQSSATGAALQPLSLTLPSGASVIVGAEGRIAAIARLADGSLRTVTELATFQSSAPSVLEFPADAPRGTYRARAVGSATVSASYDGKSASATVTIVQDGVAALTIDPSPTLVPAGTALPLRATAHHRNGTSEDVTASATWTSDAPQVVALPNSDAR